MTKAAARRQAPEKFRATPKLRKGRKGSTSDDDAGLQSVRFEAYLAVHPLHWLNTNAMKVVPDWKAAGANPLPEKVVTGVMPINHGNVAQFKHA